MNTTKFSKDFKFSLERNVGRKHDRMLLPKEDLKRKLDYVIKNEFKTWMTYFPNSKVDDYRNFWMNYLKDEIGHLKLQSKSYEHIIKTVVAFAAQKHWNEFEEQIQQKPDIEQIYSEFIINKTIPYIDVIKMIDTYEKDLPLGFKKKFIEYHKNFRTKQEDALLKGKGGVIAKVDKFTVFNKYKDLSKEDQYESFKAVIKLLNEAVQKMKSKGFDAVIYGNIILTNPPSSRTIAQYDYLNDEIILRLYRSYSGHALTALIHELAHRIWYKLMEHSDKKLWINEYEEKMFNSYKGNYRDFPSNYSKTNEREYFAEVIEAYITTGKKFSELVDLIV